MAYTTKASNYLIQLASGESEMLNLHKKLLNDGYIKDIDKCPECDSKLIGAPGGEVVCPNIHCDYWFCY